MISVPIHEAKNKLPHFIHLVEEGESLEITRHGKTVAFLVHQQTLPEQDRFSIALNHWKEKYADCFLSEEEEKTFDLPRQRAQLRHLEDFN